MNKYILLALMLLSHFSHAGEDDSLWVWQSNNDERTFSIILTKSADGYNGTYCAVAMSGRRVDCSPKSATPFITRINGEVFKFKTNYSSVFGEASLTLTGEELHWEILVPPRGEHYAPKRAVLKRHQ